MNQVAREVVARRAVVMAAEHVEPTLYERIATLLNLSSPIDSEVDLANRLKAGHPVSVVQSLQAQMDLTDEEIWHLILPRRTLNRRITLQQPLSNEEAHRTLRLARVTAHAQRVFCGSASYFIEWMRAPNGSLGDSTPLELLTSESGARAVEELLLAAEHGVFA